MKEAAAERAGEEEAGMERDERHLEKGIEGAGREADMEWFERDDGESFREADAEIGEELAFEVELEDERGMEI